MAPMDTLPSPFSRMPRSAFTPASSITGPRKAGVMPAPRLLATIRSEPPPSGMAPVSFRIFRASSRDSGMKHFTCSIAPLLFPPPA